MNPDQSDGVIRILSTVRTQCWNQGITAPQNVKELLLYLEVPDMVPYLLSMWLCFCVDKGFQDTDFLHFDCDQWLDAAEDLYEENSHTVEPHLVLVAQACRE